jgi:uncharacterized membrane protein HdeD (DUF308 family)
MEKRRFKNWGFLAVNGLICILLGILLFTFTQEFLKVVILWFGIAVLVSGAGLMISGINSIRKDRGASLVLIESIAAIAIGLILIFYPGFSLALFLVLIGVWAIIIGVVQLVVLISLKEVLASKTLLLVNALLTLLFGVLLFFNPFEWAEFMGKVIGVFAILMGVLLIYIAFLIRATVKAAWTRQI